MNDLICPAIESFLTFGLGGGTGVAIDSSVPASLGSVVAEMDGEPDPLASDVEAL